LDSVRTNGFQMRAGSQAQNRASKKLFSFVLPLIHGSKRNESATHSIGKRW